MIYPVNPKGESANKTIHDLATAARKRALAALSEAEFARTCLSFEAGIIPESLTPEQVTDEEGYTNRDDLLANTLGVLRLLAQTNEAKNWNLGIIWLDGRGYGDWTLTELFARLSDYR